MNIATVQEPILCIIARQRISFPHSEIPVFYMTLEFLGRTAYVSVSENCPVRTLEKVCNEYITTELIDLEEPFYGHYFIDCKPLRDGFNLRIYGNLNGRKIVTRIGQLKGGNKEYESKYRLYNIVYHCEKALLLSMMEIQGGENPDFPSDEEYEKMRQTQYKQVQMDKMARNILRFIQQRRGYIYEKMQYYVNDEKVVLGTGRIVESIISSII